MATKVNPARVQKILKGVNYPLSKEDILTRARAVNADEEILSALEQLPNQTFETPADINQALEMPEEKAEDEIE